MPGVGDLFVEKHDNSTLGRPSEQLGSCGCTYSVALQDHPEPLKRPVSLSHQFGGAIIVYLALDLDVSGEEVGQGSLDSFAYFCRIDLSLGFNHYLKLCRFVLTSRLMRLLRSSL